MTMQSIRGGMGLGDALYVQAVTRHLVARGARMKVHTAWPEVFIPLGQAVRTVPFSRTAQILAHYAVRKTKTGTTQFEDCCHQAGIAEPVELTLDWRVMNTALAGKLLAHAKPIVCVQMPRAPMGRKDGFGAELLPDCAAIQTAIDAVHGRALTVQVGSGEALHKFDGIDVNLANRTSVAELLDVASIASAFIGYVSFFVPLAESFSRPGLSIWSRRGLRSPHPYIAQITPKKVLHRATSRAVIDDAPAQEIAAAAVALLAPHECAAAA